LVVLLLAFTFNIRVNTIFVSQWPTKLWDFISILFDVSLAIALMLTFISGENWEKEKCLWELEQQKEWTEVMTKCQKRKAKCSKRVTFAPSPVFSPRKTSSPDHLETMALFRCSQTARTFGEMSTFWKNGSKQRPVKFGL